jgi:hypothetical protein
MEKTTSRLGSEGSAPHPGTPSVPLPPPRADQIRLEDFIEAVTRGVMRALEAQGQPGDAVSLSPQPLPPGGERALAALTRRPGLIIGIIADPNLIIE